MKTKFFLGEAFIEKLPFGGLATKALTATAGTVEDTSISEFLGCNLALDFETVGAGFVVCTATVWTAVYKSEIYLLGIVRIGAIASYFAH